ncbi:MAG: hypothetical protein IJI49_03030 [Bacilli bacterium]|nr:hypothetical protein [Bacilli bacterium]
MFVLDGYCGDLYPIIKLIKMVINLIKFAVPIALIVFITIDLVKAVIASNEEDMKKARNVAVKRIIYAVGVFLVFSVVQLVMSIIAEAGVSDLAGNEIDVQTWKACWECRNKSDCGLVETGGKGVCCVIPNDKGERYKWYASSNSCPSGGWITDMEKSKCVGNTTNIKGVCCSKEENGSVTYSWINSNVCPSGSVIQKNINKSACNGTLS